MILSDIPMLVQLLRGSPRNGTHAQRLQKFYSPQARGYDRYRERLLHGRRELIERLGPPPGARLVELGAGTGRNLLFFGERLASLECVELVDLCPALLDEARRRSADLANVQVVEADAMTWRPEQPADCVYFSYSLTMIPDWRGAIDNAVSMLKPGGSLGVVDFYVADSQPAPEHTSHNTFTRFFWPRWFGYQGVRLDPAHLRYLQASLPEYELQERHARVPWLLGLQVPHYIFVGRKPQSGDVDRTARTTPG